MSRFRIRGLAKGIFWMLFVLWGSFILFEGHGCKAPLRPPPSDKDIKVSSEDKDVRVESKDEGVPACAVPPKKLEPRNPVYNVEIEPKISREPLILIPERETQAKFFIGPQSDESLTPDMKLADVIETLAGGRPLDLTITLFSNLSDTRTFQQRKIRYDPVSRQSNSAQFQFVPKSAAVRDNDGLGKLIFVVDANGMEVDVIQIDAIVGDPTPNAREKYTAPAKLILDQLLPEEISAPDLIIALAPQESGAVPVIIRPVDRNLLQKLREVLEDPEGEFWTFRSGVSAADIGGLVEQTYMALLALAEQRHEALQDGYKRIGTPTELQKQSSLLVFQKEDTEAILRIVRDKGEDLYWRIFCRGDENLSKAMDAISAFDGDHIFKRPLRLKMIAVNIYAPWQILYPVFATGPEPSTNAKSFWGFRYEIGTLQLVDSAQGRTKTVLSPLQPAEILFGAWRGIASPAAADDVRERADFLKEHLETRIGKGIAYCLSKGDFMARLEAKSGSAKLILAYGHGSSGTELFEYTTSSGEKKVVKVPGVMGPYFTFGDGDNETLIPADIDRFARRARHDDFAPYFFKAQPIVILNACETGTAGTRTADNNGFVGALTRAGARAVFVTEAPIWANFAQHFGQDLIDLLVDGHDAQSALLKARLKHLEKAGNPLGLLYSLYGNSGARIKKK